MRQRLKQSHVHKGRFGTDVPRRSHSKPRTMHSRSCYSCATLNVCVRWMSKFWRIALLKALASSILARPALRLALSNFTLLPCSLILLDLLPNPPNPPTHLHTPTLLHLPVLLPLECLCAVVKLTLGMDIRQARVREWQARVLVIVSKERVLCCVTLMGA